LGFGDSDYMNFPMGPAPDAPEVKLHFMHCDNPRHHTVALYESPIPPSGLIHTMVEVNNVDEVGHGLDRAMQNNVHISSSLGRHSNDMMVSFYMQTPSGFDLEFGYDGWQVDWETFTKQESKIPSFWGHAFSPPES
jgi:3,4-dihydroxy-9,10-secoandrosta-1,3,5(10)-triene-9,17-dione 4,5-dioxygenase